ncbi:hypothetical protein LTR84_001480 [Exophiala bonariae]|uniref:Uncharacterized protein n=1 Tax=Exophiala bonariae TaxID=1690606 RepID=A0AAV9NG54_9EURO|nr:hypothetical protein LTR84_001480 [Exophiala bonariae]
MRWDIFAALVAIVALPLMVNQATIQLLSKLLGLLMRRIWPKDALCEVLEWRDVPDGLLHNCENLAEGQCTCTSLQALHEEPSTTHEECFSETLGTVFGKAWVSPSRRQKVVRKPHALEFRRPYIRTDRTTLRAYVMLCQPAQEYGDKSKVVTFKKVDGILTAHLHTGGDDGFAVIHIPTLTKRELECIMKGYPPFYRESIQFEDGRKLKTPIASKEDGLRGGWIVGVGLTFYPYPTLRHNLTYTSPPDDRRIWKHTNIADAVRRVGERLEDFLQYFPDELALKYGLQIYHEMLKDDGHRTMFWTLCEDKTFFDVPGASGSPEPFVRQLSVTEWDLVLVSFNRRTPLMDSAKALFQANLKTIILAVLKGLSYVLVYGRAESHYYSMPVSRIPSMEEMDGHKYIYLTTCVDEG